MSGGYSGGSAAGSAESGDGKTTVVGAKTGLTKDERLRLCDLMCRCGRVGFAVTFKSGRTRVMRQKCIEERLNLANATSRALTGSPTDYLPEVPYDMRPTPPAPPVPIMDSDEPTTPVEDVLGWINDNWPGKIGGYVQAKKAGENQIRRPDVVILRDPNQPPVQSNLRAVVEMKFDDSFRPGQEIAYKRIAGADAQYVSMRRADCGCNDDDPEKEKAPSTQSQSQSDTDELFGGSASSSKPLSPFGMPPIGPPGVSPGATLF